jgi:TPR repeat protein
MKILQKICFVLLMIMFLSSCSSVRSVYRGDCFKDKDIDDCRVKAEQGNPRAQLLLGALYLKGKGFFISSKEAVKWVRKSAEQGYARAQYLLGVMYKNRDVIEKKMTPSQIEEGQDLARVWMRNHQ